LKVAKLVVTRGNPASAGVTRWRRPGRSRSSCACPSGDFERQAHHDRVPELAARPAVLPDPPAFLDEAAPAVQGDRAFYEKLGMPVIYEGPEYPAFIAFGTETVHFGIQATPPTTIRRPCLPGKSP
jgi:hypothetical protein